MMEWGSTMGMTITEKILALHSGRRNVRPGEFIEAEVDLVLANDITAPIAIEVFKRLARKRLFSKDRVVLVADHFVPNKDIASAEQVRMMREFAMEYSIKNYFELVDSGIEHVILPEKGLVKAGDLVVGADSHTCTYGALGAFSTGVGSTDLGVTMATGRIWLRVPHSIKIVYKGRPGRWIGGKDLILATLKVLKVDGAIYKAIEFAGEGIRYLSMADRFTMANMAVEAGAKNGIFEPDNITIEYLKDRIDVPYKVLNSDRDAQYEKVIDIDLNSIEPQIALPHSPDNVAPVSEVKDVKIDQVFIGSCTNGRIEDLRVASQVLKGKRVLKGLRLIIIPGSQQIYKKALSEGLLDIFINAGAIICPPTCGPCLGGHMGLLAKGEVCLSTSNRNFRGRMGHPESEIYLCGPAVAAASSITGKITSPEEL